MTEQERILKKHMTTLYPTYRLSMIQELPVENAMKEYAEEKTKELQSRLDVATKALEIAMSSEDINYICRESDKALQQIKTNTPT